MAKRERPKASPNGSIYPVKPNVISQPDPTPVDPIIPKIPNMSLPKMLTGAFGDSCPSHGQPTKLYCYKERRFICEECMVDSPFHTKGCIKKWAMVKRTIEKKKSVRTKLNEARKKLEEQYRAIKLELEQTYEKACKDLSLFPPNQPLMNFNESEEATKLYKDMEGLTAEQYDDIFSLQNHPEFQDEASNIDENYSTHENILDAYINRLEDTTSSERTNAISSVKQLLNLK